jgi:IS5 family transposase
VARIKAGGATRTRSRDRRRAAGRRARSIASKLRLRSAAGKDEAQTAVRRLTGESGDIAGAAMRDSAAVVRNANRTLQRVSGQRKARLHRAINRRSRLWLRQRRT